MNQNMLLGRVSQAKKNWIWGSIVRMRSTVNVHKSLASVNWNDCHLFLIRPMLVSWAAWAVGCNAALSMPGFPGILFVSLFFSSFSPGQQLGENQQIGNFVQQIYQVHFWLQFLTTLVARLGATDHCFRWNFPQPKSSPELMQSTAETVARLILSKPRFSLLAPISSSCSAGKTWSLSLGFPWRVTSEVGRAVHLLCGLFRLLPGQWPGGHCLRCVGERRSPSRKVGFGSNVG